MWPWCRDTPNFFPLPPNTCIPAWILDHLCPWDPHVPRAGIPMFFNPQRSLESLEWGESQDLKPPMFPRFLGSLYSLVPLDSPGSLGTPGTWDPYSFWDPQRPQGFWNTVDPWGHLNHWIGSQNINPLGSLRYMVSLESIGTSGNWRSFVPLVSLGTPRISKSPR